ncbi:MAG: hypothetical protein Q4C12_05170 [Clostridia bacterium]|nr:hypothetical protein [Clostridia bacterium]
MKFIDTPYLPQNAVKVAISAVSVEGVKTIPPPKIVSLRGALCTHADLGFCPLGKNEAVCPPQTAQYYERALAQFGFKIICGEKSVGSNYPEDCAYNVAIIGRRALCRIDITDRRLLEELSVRGFEIINIAQGYAKCSVCPIDENFCISADKGAAGKVDSLLIENTGVCLQGFSNGFFGGCAGMIDKKTLFVTGDINTLASGKIILDTLIEKDIKVVCAHGAVYDIGSIIPIVQGE